MSVILDDYTQIADILAENQVKKPFLCCGKSFQQTALFSYLKQYNIVVFDRIRPNPRFEDMVTATELFLSEGCDFMIAAGGGSPMDSAKMIRLMVTNGTENALTQPMENNDIKSLFIPTTAGTGSEATKSSVFYVHEKEKLSIANLDFLPDYILFDETLLETLPDYQRKATCLDALCHSIESYWSKKATEESREYAAKSIRLFFEHKDSYMNNERAGNRGMLMASYYGGKAIHLTGTTAPHVLCYNITMNCSTAHGHSVAVVLAKLWYFMLERDYPAETLTALAQLMGGKTPQDGAVIFAGLLTEFGLPYPRVSEEMLDGFTAKVNTAKLQSNPIPLTANDVRELYRRVLCDGV